MTDILKEVVLGLVQGFTEFLPVSSSGHLVLFRSILGSESDAFNEISVLHLATLFAILFFYRKQLSNLIINFFKKDGSRERKTVFLLFVASIPAGIAGSAFRTVL